MLTSAGFGGVDATESRAAHAPVFAVSVNAKLHFLGLTLIVTSVGNGRLIDTEDTAESADDDFVVLVVVFDNRCDGCRSGSLRCGCSWTEGGRSLCRGVEW